MSSYFANSYIPDLRNGGVEHPHQHQQHYGAAVQVPQQTQSVQQQSQQPGDPCDPSLLRQAVSAHHYGAGGGAGGAGGQQDMPYPRFPPYNRIDMRNAAYYQHQQEHAGMDGMAGYRSGSPTTGMAHMGHTPTPNGHPSTPIVYASCKLQAAAVDHQGSVLDGPDSPPLAVETQMHHQMHTQHPHMQAQQAQQTHQQQQSQHQHLQAQQQHMMYQQQQQQQQAQGTTQQPQPGMHPQQQPQTQQHQGVVASPLGQQQQPTPQGAASANLPSPLYPWMRSQFGEQVSPPFSSTSYFFSFLFFLSLLVFFFLFFFFTLCITTLRNLPTDYRQNMFFSSRNTPDICA